MNPEEDCKTVLRSIWSAIERNERLTKDVKNNCELIEGCMHACNNSIKELIKAHAKKMGWMKGKSLTMEEKKADSIRCKDCGA